MHGHNRYVRAICRFIIPKVNRIVQISSGIKLWRIEHLTYGITTVTNLEFG